MASAVTIALAHHVIGRYWQHRYKASAVNIALAYACEGIKPFMIAFGIVRVRSSALFCLASEVANQG